MHLISALLMPYKSFHTDVRNCARCGGHHIGIQFHPFTHAPEGFTHFAACPINQEPILNTVTPDDGTPPLPLKSDKPVVVPRSMSANDANERYGERYSVDWVYEDKAKIEVYAREECIYAYCPCPVECKGANQCIRG